MNFLPVGSTTRTFSGVCVNFNLKIKEKFDDQLSSNKKIIKATYKWAF
jgi:hypothetical protein